jgi:O-acetyl-ADP-ribose deacetylase (regulator of RNase III)
VIEYKIGDLLKTPDKVLVHGCNTQGVMGSGVALAIKQKWPEVFEDYKNQIFFGAERKILGSIITSVTTDKRIIVNALTQDQYGKDGKKYVSYDAMDDAMLEIAKAINVRSPISMPKIGAGLGGGDWGVIEKIIEHRLLKHKVTIWSF